ncbi:class C metabotropic glutamate-like G-protein coupled receptor GPRmgl4, putative [Pediculus humanus corporis]|uniref:Class C metabotropic glutamate-like G-protein coupled receptor GPRmgl4, putative n=1 Tax=Pediculus humanus subsp. corporis TaxID=121224 RepID=E0VHU6_PEDHC|nr:class C metabotropic glutamate-like G-protein coupled receptor GPRmgl4, putative [Pediculus humanus corporis]EEB12952.1 class C metabotropic glutamate-like G-protein coupled receptor GPRmgl4, putative [Pediculus humanus corporis]
MRFGSQWRIIIFALLTIVSADDIIQESIKSSRFKSRTHTRLDMSTEFFIIPSKSEKSTTTIDSSTNTAAVVVVTRRTPTCTPGLIKSDVPCVPSVHQLKNKTDDPYFTPLNDSTVLRQEGWVIPLLVLSSLTMISIAGFEVFVLCKAWRTSPSRRHLFLGQMLLLGLFLCAGLGGVVTVSPNVVSCATVRFGVGLAFAIVFSTLLVKNVFLISLNSGVYLPAPYQALLLLFAVLIQLVVDVQWLVNSPPKIDVMKFEGLSSLHRKKLVVTADDLLFDTSNSVSVCHTPYTEILMSLIYVVFLIVFVAILAIKSRGIRDNYREATYIGLSVGCIIPMWMIWAITGLVLSERHKDACIGFGLVSTSVIIFLIMFMPKGRQLAAMGKDGVYVEDREDRFSTLTPAGSGYSPSFFHLKPSKYGMVNDNMVPTLTTHKTNPSAATSIGACFFFFFFLLENFQFHGSGKS